MSADLEKGEHLATVKGDQIEVPSAVRELWGLQDGDVLMFWQHPLSGFICVRLVESSRKP